MATTGQSAERGADDAAIASTLCDATVAHFVSHADGDSVAAAGLLATAVSPATPVQISTVRTVSHGQDRIEDSPASTISVGFDAPSADTSLEAESNALAAFEIAEDIDSADPILALAGAIAAGISPHGAALEDALDAGVHRRPGVGIPTADLADGLAHSTLFHADVSDDEQRAGALLAELGLPAELEDGSHRRLASAVSLTTTESPAPESAVSAIETVLRPHVIPDGPFQTVEGVADVLDGLSRAEPGLASALALGLGDRNDVLDAWRDHARATHEAVRLGDRTRVPDLVIVESDGGDPWTTARLVRDFRTAEPAALVLGDTDLALATTETNALSRLDAIDGVGSVGGRANLASGEIDADPATILASLEARE